MPTVQDYLAAGRADAIPAGTKGLWYTRKIRVPFPLQMSNGRVRESGEHTTLLRWTDSTMHTGHGECVMVDDPAELRTHLHAARTAYGNVFVTGLGLGCVLRMLQLNPQVARITVVERDRHVIDLVWPHTPHDRVELVWQDALAFLEGTDRTWDCAWHDAWTDTDQGEPQLQVFHAKLMIAASERVLWWQGAWKFPRHQRRAIDRALAGA